MIEDINTKAAKLYNILWPTANFYKLSPAEREKYYRLVEHFEMTKEHNASSNL